MEERRRRHGRPFGHLREFRRDGLGKFLHPSKVKGAVRVVPVLSMFRPSGGEIQALSFFESVLQGGKTGGFRGSGSLGTPWRFTTAPEMTPNYIRSIRILREKRAAEAARRFFLASFG